MERNNDKVVRLAVMRHMGLAFLVFAPGTLSLSASAAEFITINRTVGGGNPLNENHNGSSIFVGVNSAFTRIPDLQVDVTDPGLFGYNDQTGGGISAYSNSLLNVQGGTFGVSGGTGAPGGGITLNDTSRAIVTAGNINYLYLGGAGAGASGVQAVVSGGLISASNRIISSVSNGQLSVTGGTIRANSGQPGLVGGANAQISISGGLVQSVSGSGVFLGDSAALVVTGGVISGADTGAQQRGIYLGDVGIGAMLSGGTVNGGLSAVRTAPSSPVVQATLSGAVTVNGGVFAYSDAAVDVFGGAYTDYGGAAAFLAMGANTINFFGAGLTLSGPTAGVVFDTNNIPGNFYTFTGGTFRDGQSAVGLRLFDATGPGASGGFTLNPTTTSAAPEPSTLALLTLAPLALLTRRRYNRA